MTPQSSNESDLDKQIPESKFKKSDDDQEVQSILKKPESEKEEASQSNSATLHEIEIKESSVKNGLALNSNSQNVVPVTPQGGVVEESGQKRLKRHRGEVAGQVWIPDMWGQEELLKDWIDCSAFDASWMNSNIMLARAALVQQGTRPTSGRLIIENSC